MNAHTKGPWQITHLRDGTEHVNEFRIGTAKYGVICQTHRTTEDDPKPMANARLIAAAPDLLEACQSFVDAWDNAKPYARTDFKERQQRIAVARAAIQKASGGK